MQKNIFITGAVREYDSSKPEEFTNAIANFIKENMVDEKSRSLISVKVREVSTDHLVITFPFYTGEESTDKDSISHKFYCFLFGQCKAFIPKHSLGPVMNLGPNIHAIWREDLNDVKNAHKRNTTFYGGDTYKRLELSESKYGLETRFIF